uniref:Receptor protein-tyrosine kinase n=1 Tax=Heterorhabditis bacteriophora TaxID=37862 RepID=A0A1I7XMJ1_HETBA
MPGPVFRPQSVDKSGLKAPMLMNNSEMNMHRFHDVIVITRDFSKQRIYSSTEMTTLNPMRMSSKPIFFQAFPLARGETTWNQDDIDKCGYSCRINSVRQVVNCHHGCHDFDEPISKCDTRCAKEEIAFDSCSQGCYAVEHAFLVQIQELINQVSVIIDVVEDKLRLKWIFPFTVLPQLQEVAAADVLWFTQSREIASNTGWKWTALTNTVRLALCYRNQVGVSHPVTYQMPFTATKSVIEVISQLQVATDKLALCWNGSQTMVTFLFIVLIIRNKIYLYRCHLFKSLPKENCCRATISDLSREDGLPGSETSVKIEMIQVPASAFEEFGPPKERLLFSSGSHLYQLRDANDYLISEEPIPIAFEMPQGELITAVVGISSDSVVVGSSRGGLWLLNMEYNDTLVDSTPTIMKESNGDGHVITQIEYDAMQQCVYAVVADRGVVRCTIEGKKCSFLANSDSLNPIRQISVDGNNGFIYFLGADHQIYRSELFPINAPETFNFPTTTLLTDLSPASALELVQDSFELIVALKNGTVLSQNLVSGKVTLKRSEEYPQVIRMCMVGDKLYWLREKCGDTSPDEMCFFTEEKNGETGAIHFSRYLYSGKILDFALLRDPLAPPILVSPEKIGLVVSDSKARITWLPPVNMPFQATNNGWRNISYDVKMVTPDSPDSPLVEQTTNGGDVTVSVLPGAEYTASVRACWNRVCSNFVNAINSAFVSFKLSNPFCCDTIFSMDNTTKTWYYVAPNEGVVHHWKSVEHSVPFAKYLSINFVSVLQTRAILILAASYQIISYRLTGTVEHVVYSCPSPIENCAEVVGLSSDDTTGEIYFAVQSTNGTVALFELNQEDRTPRLLATSIDLPQLVKQIRQLLVTHEKVIFVTKEGRVGSCDKKLGSLNINLALSNIDMVVAVNPTELNNVFDFLGEVNIGQNRKDEVGWAIEPRQQAGKVLYKMSLFRDKLFVGDAHTEITTSLSFILPPSLLESWSSAQRFDINIAGLSAWTTASVNKTALQAPVKPPTAPTNVRLYATQQEDGTNQGGPLSSSITHYAFAVKSGKVECTVAAANEPSNIGEYTAPISIDSSELKPLVRLFAIDSTNALIAINNVTQDEPAKRKKRQIAQMEYQAIAFIGNDLFAVRKEHDTIQPLLVQIDTNDIDNIVHKVSIGGDVSKIDALTSDWVGNRLLFVSGMALYQLSLDPFLTTSLLTPKKLIELSTGATDAKQLTFDPFKNNAYLLTRNGSLFSLNLSRGLEQNLALVVPCLSSQTVTWMMTGSQYYSEFAWNRASSPKIYALTWNGLIVVDVEENNKCNEVRIDWNKFGEKGLKAMSAFAIADKLFVFVTSSEMLIYGRETVVPIPIANPPLRQILAVSQSSQPYPERTCFSLPSSSDIQFAVINEGKTGAFIEVVKPPPPTTCQGVSLPQTHYEVYFKRKNSDKVKHIRSFTEKIHIENGILDKETDYDVTVAWLNRYSAVSSISDARTFRTGFGYPSAPRSLQATPITPDTIYLFWNLPDTLNAPIAEIKYKISQQTAGLTSPSSIAVQEYSEGVFSPTTSDSASCFSNPCRVKISNLRPSTEYKFWATAIHKSHLNSQFLEDAEAVSQEVTTRTKDIAGTLRPDNVTGSSLLLRWNSLQAEQPPSLISVQYKESGGISEWKAPSNASFDPSVSTILVLINGLLSATTYDYRFVAAYTGTYTIDNRVTGYKEDYYQGVQQAKTKAGVPTAPLMVEARMDDEGWIVSWKEPLSDGGSPITSYAVEMRINKTSEWEIAERGLDGWKLWWRPAKSYTQGADWEFRVRAANQEGFGSYGCSSDNRVIVPEKESSSSWLYVVLGVSLTAVLILLALIFVMC